MPQEQLRTRGHLYYMGLLLLLLLLMEVANLLKVLQRWTTDLVAKVPEEIVPRYSQVPARLPQPKKPFLPVWSIGPLLPIVPSSSHSLRPLRSTIQ